MAAKVNTKFVVALAAGLFALFCGVAGVAIYTSARSADRLVAEGDRHMDEGEYRRAASAYSRAVFKDQSNSANLQKWFDAISNVVYETEAETLQQYQGQYFNALRQLAIVNPTNAQHQINFIEERDRQVRIGGSSAQAFEGLLTDINDRAQQLDLESDGAKELLGYRGRATVDLMNLVPVDEERRDQALRDLERAAEADPEDWRSGAYIVFWRRAEAERLEGAIRVEEAEEQRQAADRAFDALRRRIGDRPELINLGYAFDAAELFRGAGSAEDRLALIDELRPLADRATDELLGVPPAEFTADAVDGAMGRLAPVLDEAGRTKLIGLVERVLEERPEDSRVLLALAQLYRVSGDTERAVEMYERVIGLPDLPVSIEAIILPQRRLAAAAGKVDTLLGVYERAETDEARAEALERAKRYRDELAQRVTAMTEWEVSLRDARIALIERDFDRAVALLGQIRETGASRDARIDQLLAQALAAQGNLGEARRLLEGLLSGTEDDPFALIVQLADIEVALRNIDRARALYELALRRRPNDERLARTIAELDVLEAEDGAEISESVDPVFRAVISARKARIEGDLLAAREITREALEANPGTPVLVREAVQIELEAEDRDAAIVLVEAAIEADPDNEAFPRVLQRLRDDDPLATSLALIDESDASPLDKALSRFRVYVSYNRSEEAAAALADAERIDPRSPAVIEISFTEALSRGDEGLAEARRWAERAAETNADNRGGLTYRGRLELAEGNTSEAIVTLERAIERMAFDPQAWRWLGVAQSRAGRVADALESLERAYSGKPDDASIAVDYARALVAAGRGPEALAVISPRTGVLGFGQRGPALLELWLQLEAQHGDRDAAIDQRRRLLANNPGNAENGRALALLLVEDGLTDEANEVIATLDAAGDADGLLLARLRAVVAAEGGDADAGRALLNAHIEATPEADRGSDAYLALAEYEREYGDFDGAIRALDAGRPFQDEKQRQADRALGDLLFNRGVAIQAQAARVPESQPDLAQRVGAEARETFTRSASAYERVLEGEPEDARVLKRLAEVYLNLERYADAEAMVARVPTADDDLQALMLRAAIAEARGETGRAQGLLDTAVERHPNDAQAFLARARLNRDDEALFPDVMADLEQAIELRPDLLEAWTMRFNLYAQRQEIDRAFGELARAMEANPDNERLLELRVSLLRRAGRADEATSLALETARARPDDPKWAGEAALLAFERGNFRDAVAMYERLYELDPDPTHAADLLNCLLYRPTPPSRREVNLLLPPIQGIENKVPGVHMLIARAHEFLGETGAAEVATLEAFRAAGDDPLELRLWFDQLLARFKGDAPRVFAYMSEDERFRPLPPTLEMLVIGFEMSRGLDASAALARLEDARDASLADPLTTVQYVRLRVQLMYTLGMYEELVEAAREGLAIAPNDFELNNNVAYTLSKHQNDARGALPFAQRAAAAAPLNSSVLDTLGQIYVQSGRAAEAVPVLQRALATSESPSDRVPASLHLAQAYLELGDVREAGRFLEQARGAMAEATELIREQYRPDIESLEERLD